MRSAVIHTFTGLLVPYGVPGFGSFVCWPLEPLEVGASGTPESVSAVVRSARDQLMYRYGIGITCACNHT